VGKGDASIDNGRREREIRSKREGKAECVMAASKITRGLVGLKQLGHEKSKEENLKESRALSTV